MMIINGDDLMETGNVFFTGCTHFGHKNIIKLANRPFDTVGQMNEALIDRWNRSVMPEDTVIHLGDFSWGEAAFWRRQLHGNLIHIKGNHDHGIPWKTHDYAELRYGGKRLILFHYPIEEWNGWWKGTWHLHCHTHQSEVHTAKQRINVTVEAWDHAPVSLSHLMELIK